jgi:hypothetical protein
MGIEPSSGKNNCWMCGSVKPIDIVMGLTGLSMPESYKIMKEYETGKVYRAAVSYDDTPLTVELPPIGKFTPPEMMYLKSRNIQEDKIKLYDIRSGGVTGFFQYRIIFPIYKNNKIISATSRAIFNNPVRYLTLPPQKELIHHKKTLYGIDFTNHESVILVEGIIDAVRGGPGFVSSFGTSITPEQILLLTKYKKVYMIGDNDMAGEKAVKKVTTLLATLTDTEVYSVVIKGSHKDVGELPESLIQELKMELQ